DDGIGALDRRIRPRSRRHDPRSRRIGRKTAGSTLQPAGSDAKLRIRRPRVDRFSASPTVRALDPGVLPRPTAGSSAARGVLTATTAGWKLDPAGLTVYPTVRSSIPRFSRSIPRFSSGRRVARPPPVLAHILVL